MSPLTQEQVTIEFVVCAERREEFVKQKNALINALISAFCNFVARILEFAHEAHRFVSSINSLSEGLSDT